VHIGYLSGSNATTGAYNTFVGGESGSANAGGSYNTYLGFQAGDHLNGGNGNTFLGQFAGSVNTSGSNNVYVGNQGVTSESNTIRIGDPATQNAAYMAGIYGVTSASGVPVFVNSNGQLGTQTSSRRYKEEIREMGDATGALMKLRPVTFYYKHEYDNGPRTLQYGLIAEEVAKVFPELVAYNLDGSPYTVRYQFPSSMLLNEVQKQYHRSQQQANVIEAQQQTSASASPATPDQTAAMAVNLVTNAPNVQNPILKQQVADETTALVNKIDSAPSSDAKALAWKNVAAAAAAAKNSQLLARSVKSLEDMANSKEPQASQARAALNSLHSQLGIK